jgi:hypothetical protein
MVVKIGWFLYYFIFSLNSTHPHKPRRHWCYHRSHALACWRRMRLILGKKPHGRHFALHKEDIRRYLKLSWFSLTAKRRKEVNWRTRTRKEQKKNKKGRTLWWKRSRFNLLNTFLRCSGFETSFNRCGLMPLQLKSTPLRTGKAELLCFSAVEA